HSMSRTFLRRLCAVGIAMLACASCERDATAQDAQAVAAAAHGPINALWNDSEGFGIQVYDGRATCPRDPNPDHFLFLNFDRTQIGKVTTLDMAQMKTCASFRPKSDVMIVRCTGGTVTVSYLDGAREYVGKYDL